MINKLTIENVRGKTFDLEFDKLNLIVGQNRSGKTTIADSLRFALLGYIPGMPKPFRQWSELFPPKTNVISISTVSDLGLVKTSLTLDASGGVKPVKSGAGLFAHANALTLDQGKYFNATGPEQAAMIAACASVDFDWQAMVPERIKDRFPIHNGDTWQSNLEPALEFAKASRTNTMSIKAMYQQTKQAMSLMREIVDDPTQKQNELNALIAKQGSLQHQLEVLNREITSTTNLGSTETDEMELRTLRARMSPDLYKDADDPVTWQRRLDNNVQRVIQIKAKKGYMDTDAYAKVTWELGGVISRSKMREEDKERVEANIRAVRAHYSEMTKAGKCPTCGHAGPAFKMNVQDLEKEDLERLYAEQVNLGKETYKLAAEAKKLQKKIDTAKELNGILGQIQYEEKSLQLEKARIDLRNKIRDLGAKIVASRAARASIEQAEQAIYHVENELQDVAEAIGKLSVEVKEIQNALSQKRQLAKTEELLQAEEVKLSTITQDIKELTELRDRFTILSLAPILSTVEMFTKGIFETPLQLDGSELGRFVGSRWVALRQFSGTEQMVSMAALMCALGSSQKENYVVVDELGIMDSGHLNRFLINVDEAIKEKVVTQFWGFSTPREVTMVHLQSPGVFINLK